MRNVTIKKTIKCDLTADQWQLFVNSPELAEKCHRSAVALNQRVEMLFNNYGSIDARKNMISFMERYADVGAVDSEPLGVLEDLLELFYL